MPEYENIYCFLTGFLKVALKESPIISILLFSELQKVTASLNHILVSDLNLAFTISNKRNSV